MRNLSLCIFLVGIYSSALISNCESLEIVNAGTLPTPRTATAAVYDNDDAVYILGGLGIEPINDVLRYDLSTETVQKVGSFPHVSIWGGSAHFDVNGDIFYFAGLKNDDGFGTIISTIWKFNAANSNPLAVADLPQPVTAHCSVYDGQSGVFVMGGASLTEYQNQVFYYNIATNVTQAWIPETPILRAGAACAGYGESSYIFGGFNTFETPIYLNSVLKSTPLQPVETLDTTFPNPIHSASAVTVGEYVYVIGGETGTIGGSNYVNRFNPLTEEIIPLMPEGFKNGLIETSSVYVPKSNRIYVFGGFESLTGFQDNIFYIQLE